MRILRTLLAAASSVILLVPPAGAQTAYPARPVTFVVSYAPGASADVVVRGITQEITRQHGVPVVIEHRPGASNFLAAQHVARAQPDGYTLLVTGNSTFTSNRHLFKSLPYEPDKDFQPITTVSWSPLLLVVGPSVQAKNMRELLAFARQNPDKLTFADATAVTRVGGELLQRTAGVKLTRIPYKATTQAFPDLMSGQVDMMFADLTAMRLVKEGRLRAFALTDAKRSPFAPDVPTLSEVGVPGMDSVGFSMMLMAPAGTPMAVVEKLRGMVTQAARTPEVEASYAGGAMLPLFTTPAELARRIASESVVWGELVKAAGIEPQ